MSRRPPPSARRMAISLRRAAPRASIILATLREAISRTTAAMESRRMGKLSPVEAKRAAEHRGVGAVAFPEGIADNRHGGSAAGAFLIGGKNAGPEARDAPAVDKTP